MDLLLQSWPWYIAGPLIGLTVPFLLLLVGKPFGISSSFRHLNSACSPNSNLDYLQTNDLRGERWNLFFILGIVAGGFVAMRFLSAEPIPFLPEHYHSGTGVIKLLVGGLLVGFGTRYADGCTSGHSIMGLSNLKFSSLVATICFFAGGLLIVWVVRPLVP